jgi:hypothetical protein
MTGARDGANRVLGALRRIDDLRGALRIEDVYDTDVDDLWSALTDPARLARWVAVNSYIYVTLRTVAGLEPDVNCFSMSFR